MLLILSIFILVFIALVIAVVHVLRPTFSYFWLLAAIGVWLAWPLVLISRSRVPERINLFIWEFPGLAPISTSLLLDSVSWSFALALITLALSMVLTDVAPASADRKLASGWSDLASSLFITGISTAAVLSGDLITILMAWAALDLAESIIWLLKTGSGETKERAIIAFSTRLAGIFLAVWAVMVSARSGTALTFDSLTPQTSTILLIAAGVRLGVIPPNTPLPRLSPPKRGIKTMLRIAPASASLVLLARTASVGVAPALSLILLAFSVFAAIYGSLTWAMASEELEGGLYWVLGIASLSFGAAVRTQPEASLAWGIAMLLSGGLISLFSARARWLSLIIIFGAINISALPFTPTWYGASVFSPLLSVYSILFLVSYIFLLSGFLKHAFSARAPLSGAERWVWLIYPWGLGLLPLTNVLIAWLGRPVSEDLTPLLPSGRETIPAVIGSILVILGLILQQRGVHFPTQIWGPLKAALSLNWLYRSLWALYAYMRRIFSIVNLALEGGGGILWALLIMALLISLYIQIGRGG